MPEAQSMQNRNCPTIRAPEAYSSAALVNTERFHFCMDQLGYALRA
jgi:hypothetical protein